MFDSLAEIKETAAMQKKPFWKVIQESDCLEEGISEEESIRRVRKILEAMKESVMEYDPKLKSASGLVGDEGAKIEVRRKSGELLAGDLIGLVMERALKIADSNACMKRIAAAPTAGSCGVVPSVLLTVQEARHISDEQMLEALYISAGIGGVIAQRASLAGAEGGCQAEIGSASAMAAGSCVWLLGGGSEEIVNASALALKGLLGLVCDPVAGLVEIPCVKRNVIGAVNAVTCADMAMAGITSRIDPDQVIDSMRSVGHALPASLRETGEGGLAGTPSGQEIRRRIREE